jgi:hypothetical protein
MRRGDRDAVMPDQVFCLPSFASVAQPTLDAVLVFRTGRNGTGRDVFDVPATHSELPTLNSIPGDSWESALLEGLHTEGRPRSVASRYKSNGKATRTAFCVARRPDRLSHLGTSLPNLSTL